MSGSTPAARCCASSSWRWVVVAGWLISVRVSPMFTRWLMNIAPSMNFSPAAAPPFTPNASRPEAIGMPSSARICCFSSACCGCSASPG